MILLTDVISQSSNFCVIVLDETTYYISAFAVDSNGTIIDVQSGNITTDFVFAGYQQVEYIQSSGSQYISTGYNPKTITEFEIEYTIVSYISKYSVPMGTRYQHNNQAYYFGYENNNNSYYGFGNNKADPSSVSFAGIGTKRKITYHNNILSNGTQSVTVATNQQPYGTIRIFAEEQAGSIQELCAMKLYMFKLWEGSTLIREYIPCYRKSDSVIGLWDRVNKVFYTNAGSGTFTKGPDL